MNTVGERYAYFYTRVAELELKLKLAAESMCPECRKKYEEKLTYTEPIA